jgi:glutamate 5-kinase
MITKLQAAKTAGRSGAATVFCNGSRRDILTRIASGERIGTLVLPGERLASKKHWLAYTSRTLGELVIDGGAGRALVDRGRSLLPSGVLEVRGRFHIGDPVACVGVQGAELARGLTAYAAEEVERIKGLPTRDISRVLGYSNGDEVIHRDDLVVLDRDEPGSSESRKLS